MTRKNSSKKSPSGSISIRLARVARSLHSWRPLRVLGGRGAATVVLGAALSVGGLTDMLNSVHFTVQKDLDSVRVVRQMKGEDKVVANVQGDFKGNTLFKLSGVLPDRYVSRELALFDGAWLAASSWLEGPPTESAAGRDDRDLFYEEMKRMNDAIREEFFASTIPYGELIFEKAKKYDVDPALVAAVIEQESRFKPQARSHAGARGLMQLMPRTGKWMGARDLYDPSENVDAGVKYIKYLDKRFNGDLKKTIAAYNGGEGNVKRYQGIPPFRETRQYVKKVLTNYDKRNKQLETYQKEQLGGSVPEIDGTLALR